MSSADDRAEIETDDYGSSRARLPTREGIKSSVEVWAPDDEEATLSVSGYAYDEGDDPSVQLSVTAGTVDVSLTVSPARAREIATDLETAADHATNE
jgi:hypothetical protein